MSRSVNSIGRYSPFDAFNGGRVYIQPGINALQIHKLNSSKFKSFLYMRLRMYMFVYMRQTFLIKLATIQNQCPILRKGKINRFIRTASA